MAEIKDTTAQAATGIPHKADPLWRLECLGAEYKGAADMIRWMNLAHEEEGAVSELAARTKQSALFFLASALDRLNEAADEAHADLHAARRTQAPTAPRAA